MKQSHESVHPLILSSVFHYEFVFIHPFSDGNGRMARLWHTAILSQWKPLFEYIPIESQIEKFQEQYYDAIARCHADGSSTIFIEFMLSQIDQVLDEISIQISDSNEQLSEYVKKLINAMEYDIPYTSNTLMEKLGLKSKEGSPPSAFRYSRHQKREAPFVRVSLFVITNIFSVFFLLLRVLQALPGGFLQSFHRFRYRKDQCQKYFRFFLSTSIILWLINFPFMPFVLCGYTKTFPMMPG